MRTLGIVLVAVSALAQDRPPRLTYEVVSIKQHEPGAPAQRWNDPLHEGGRLRFSGIPLSALVTAAFREPGAAQQLNRSQIIGLPNWADTELFDVEAMPESGFVPTYDETVGMIRALLEDRFALKTHREARDETVLALTMAKDGTVGKKGLRLSADQTTVNRNPKTDGTPEVASGTDPSSRPVERGWAQVRLGKVTAVANTIGEFAAYLSLSIAGRPVLDRTELKGLYDIEFQYTPDYFRQLPPDYKPPQGTIIPDPDGPSFFQALEQQLGLKLTSAAGTVPKIVVDHVEKPAAN